VEEVRFGLKFNRGNPEHHFEGGHFLLPVFRQERLHFIRLGVRPSLDSEIQRGLATGDRLEDAAECLAPKVNAEGATGQPDYVRSCSGVTISHH
jgi:hypothetical protein